MNIATMPETNIRSFDRILSLSVIDNKAPKATTGLIDRRLFSGEQQLHLAMDIQTNLWSFRYSSNTPLPEPLQGHFTSFTKGFEHAKNYFNKRNVEITEVKD